MKLRELLMQWNRCIGTSLFVLWEKFCYGSSYSVVHGIHSGTMKENKGMAVKKNRKLKVYEQAGYGYKEVPAIVLRGKWLKECGFDVGTKYRVECEEGRLVIVREE